MRSARCKSVLQECSSRSCKSVVAKVVTIPSERWILDGRHPVVRCPTAGMGPTQARPGGRDGPGPGQCPHGIARPNAPPQVSVTPVSAHGHRESTTAIENCGVLAGTPGRGGLPIVQAPTAWTLDHRLAAVHHLLDRVSSVWLAGRPGWHRTAAKWAYRVGLQVKHWRRWPAGRM